MLKLLFWATVAITNAFSFTVVNKHAFNLRKNFPSSPSLKSSLKPYIEKLVLHEDLLPSEAEDAFSQILTGADPIQVGSLLTLLRAKGETSPEIAAMIRAMNSACLPVTIPGPLLDIVGTGGDGADTINISTASAVLAAACGCVVCKAGNRSVSSKCGSADVLEQLGINVPMSPAQVEECVKRAGIGFMFAPINHPAMRFVAPVRKALGVRTAFNILGPMTNAAQAQHAVIGVFDGGFMELMADSLVEVGRVDHAVVIHGCGLDEISPLGPSEIIEIKRKEGGGGYDVNKFAFDPLDIGIPRCKLEDLKGGDPEMNKSEFLRVLKGGDERNAKRDSICLNAGVGNYVYGLCGSIVEGVELAREVLEQGKAEEVLETWIRVSNEVEN